MLRRRHLYFLTRGNAEGAPYIDLQLRPVELQAIGHVTAQWAFLELAILRETRNLARYLGIPPPVATNIVSFKRRAHLWKELSLKALATFDEELRRALDCIERAKHLANERHRLTHDVIEYDPEDENRLKAFPSATLGKFGWPLDAARIEKTAMSIAHLTHDVLSIHNDPVIARNASRRTQDRPDRHGPLPASGSRGRRQANSLSRKPQR